MLNMFHQKIDNNLENETEKAKKLWWTKWWYLASHLIGAAMMKLKDHEVDANFENETDKAKKFDQKTGWLLIDK